MHFSASAALVLIVNIDINGVIVAPSELLGFFLGKGISRDHYNVLVKPKISKHRMQRLTLEGLLDIDRLFGTGLEIWDPSL